MHEADESGTLQDVLTADVLANLKRIPGIVRHLYAKCLSRMAKSEDLPKVQLVEAGKNRFEEYQGASENYEHEPKLSLVITINQSDSQSLLESLVEEDMASLECLVIKNTQDSEIRDSLEELADLYPNVRLWQTDGPVTTLQALKLALQEAKGASVSFLKGNDEVDSDFIENAIKAFSLKEPVDLAVFGMQSFDGEGRDLSGLQEGLMEKNQLVRTFFEQDLSLDLRGILFAKELLQKSLSDIDPVFPNEGDEYLLKAFNAVTKAYVSPQGMVSCSEEEDAPLVARACDVVQNMDEKVAAVKRLLADEKEDEDLGSSEFSASDEMTEKVEAYCRKAMTEKYLPTILEMVQGDINKAEKYCARKNYEISDVHMLILCAESSHDCDAYEQE